MELSDLVLLIKDESGTYAWFWEWLLPLVEACVDGTGNGGGAVAVSIVDNFDGAAVIFLDAAEERLRFRPCGRSETVAFVCACDDVGNGGGDSEWEGDCCDCDEDDDDPFRIDTERKGIPSSLNES